MDQNELFRFGSARPATKQEIRKAGYFERRPESVFAGFAYGKPLFGNQDASFYLQAGSRSGKLTDIIAFSLCQGIYMHSIIAMDCKFELADISRQQIIGRKYCIYWNPTGDPAHPQHRINPVCYIRIDNPSLISDVKLFCQNILPLSGSPQAEFFELRAQAFMEAIILTIVRLDGVLTFPRLYQIINLIPGNSDEWLSFAWEMHEGSQLERAIEEEIAASRQSDNRTVQNIISELLKALAPLTDNRLMESVSPPYTMSMADLCGSQPYHVYIMAPAEFVESWAPIIKALFVCAFIYKRRAGGHCTPQLWLLDECALLKGFPIVLIVFSLGATYEIRAFAVFQTHSQAKAIAKDADSILPASAGLSWQFGIRDTASAERLSQRLGMQSLYFDDTLRQHEADMARKKAVRDIISGGDPIEAGMRAEHYRRASQHRSCQQRLLQTPAEILGMPRNRMWISADGLEHSIYAERWPYYEQRWMAGNFHPSRFFPPLDKVRVKTLLGHAWKRVIREPVPQEFADMPQYADGFWTRIAA
ncbi:type IV secretory system conjugative DNA transfer family protein [Novosphingobium beihaiensis]|uniref:Type IV secretory system conjugative DNA transfer family protein n=1 Tax=Novosphingobium beihaiensis TaxID=2930389 RepID=A0ABT0BS68_9SPHN|nr:type IV secretory system conjugative DNA transfer family protein [Novosphingobium beihaiensis]MCJ2187899.1 type IV secretory system conjugative DNA transfer family protein [Novosphingobium beihaiensis]